MKKKILYALLSAVIAFGLWAYVVTTVSPEWEETYYNIPVVMNNESVLHDNGLMIMEEQAPTVTLKLRGNRSDLVTLNRGNITLIANLATIYEKGEQQISYNILFPENISNNSIEVLNKSPQVLTLTVAERKTVQVPVELDFGDTTVPEGYWKDTENLVLDHETITVAGPAETVDKITSAKVFVDLNDQTKTISQSFSYTFCDESGAPVQSNWLEVSASEVNLTLKIQPTKLVQLQINVIAGGGVGKEDITYEIDVPQIQIAGPKQQLDKIGDALVIDLDLGKIAASDGAAEVERAIELPEGVVNLTGNDTVKITIQFLKELKIRAFTIDTITPANVPEGMKATVDTRSLKVTIRGAAKQVDALKEDNLRLLVDFANATVGQSTYKVTLEGDGLGYGLFTLEDPYIVTASVSRVDG